MTKETAVIAQSQLNQILHSSKTTSRSKLVSRPLSVSARAPFKTDPIVSRRSSANSRNRKGSASEARVKPKQNGPQASVKQSLSRNHAKQSISNNHRVKSAEKMSGRETTSMTRDNSQISETEMCIALENARLQNHTNMSDKTDNIQKSCDEVNLNETTSPVPTREQECSAVKDQFEIAKHG